MMEKSLANIPLNYFLYIRFVWSGEREDFANKETTGSKGGERGTLAPPNSQSDRHYVIGGVQLVYNSE